MASEQNNYTWGDECEASKEVPAITYHHDVIQGSEEWLAQRCGMLTASEMHFIVTPTLRVANNEKTRMHLYELLAQRITKHVEPHYISDDMLRGKDDELEARMLYSRDYYPVDECGFVTRTFPWGTVGYSPDGLIGESGLLECKSRRQKYQVQTFVEWGRKKEPPVDFMLQVQTGLWVTQRRWCDLVSYSGGLPMCVMRVHPDEVVHEALEQAAKAFEESLQLARADYERATHGLQRTERRVVQEMFT